MRRRTANICVSSSPAKIDRGAAYEFVLHDVMALANPMDAFRLVVTDV
jgi:hypothetical protein